MKKPCKNTLTLPALRRQQQPWPDDRTRSHTGRKREWQRQKPAPLETASWGASSLSFYNPTKGGWVKNNKTKNMHIWTIPVQKYIAETGKKHKYKENATCRTSTPPLLNVVSKTSWALWVNVQVCFVEICFFFYFPKENDKHTVTLIRGQPSLTSLQASWRKKKIECSTTEKNISRTPQERKNNVTKLFLFIIFREFYKIPAKLQPFFPCSLLNHRQPSITQATTVRFQ